MASYISANELRPGSVFAESGRVYVVLKYNHIKKARAQAVIRVKVRDIENANVTENTYNSDQKLEEADTHKRSAQFMYADDEYIHMMDSTDFEQLRFEIEGLPADHRLLKEGEKLIVLYLNSKPISVEFPTSVELEVEYAPDVSAGGTVTNPTKKVRLETGLEVQAPMFITTGEKIKVNTDDLTYISRA